MSTDASSTRVGRLPASLTLAPGIALLFAVGYLGKVAEHGLLAWGQAHHRAVPDIDYVLWAILIGIIVGSTIGVPRPFRAGVATYGFWLRLGIVLLGARFVLTDMLRLGALSLAATAVELAVSIALMTWLGRRLKLKPKLISLLAIGSSICGVSAIIAAKGAIDADDEDASYAIAVILALGAVEFFAFPLIGHSINLSEHAYGLWAGLAIDNTAEATAAGAIWSDEAGHMAVLAKTTRNATIGFVVLGYALYWAARGQAPGIETKAAFLWAKFPKFVLGFLAVSLLAALGAFTPVQASDLTALSYWAFLLAFAGVGLMTDLRGLLRQGALPLLVGAAGEIAISAVTLAIVLGLGPWLP